MTPTQAGFLARLLPLAGLDVDLREKIKTEFDAMIDSLRRDMKCELKKERFIDYSAESDILWLRDDARRLPFVREVVRDRTANKPGRFGVFGECEVVAYSITTGFTQRIWFVHRPLAEPTYLDGMTLPRTKDRYGGELVDVKSVRARAKTMPADPFEVGHESYGESEQAYANESHQWTREYYAVHGYEPAAVTWLPTSVREMQTVMMPPPEQPKRKWRLFSK